MSPPGPSGRAPWRAGCESDVTGLGDFPRLICPVAAPNASARRQRFCPVPSICGQESPKSLQKKEILGRRWMVSPAGVAAGPRSADPGSLHASCTSACRDRQWNNNRGVRRAVFRSGGSENDGRLPRVESLLVRLPREEGSDAGSSRGDRRNSGPVRVVTGDARDRLPGVSLYMT
jgi:hypothetical protein